MKLWTRLILIMACGAGAVFTAQATDDPPANPNPDPTLAADQARTVSKVVKQNVKVAVDATKEGAQQVADKARAVAHEVAVATQEGVEKTKAVLSDSKPTEKPSDKPAAP